MVRTIYQVLCAIVFLAKAIYPDRFADIDPDAVRREYAAESGFDDEQGTEWFYPSSGPVNATATAANVTMGGGLAGERVPVIVYRTSR